MPEGNRANKRLVVTQEVHQMVLELRIKLMAEQHRAVTQSEAVKHAITMYTVGPPPVIIFEPALPKPEGEEPKA